MPARGRRKELWRETLSGPRQQRGSRWEGQLQPHPPRVDQEGSRKLHGRGRGRLPGGPGANRRERSSTARPRKDGLRFSRRKGARQQRPLPGKRFPERTAVHQAKGVAERSGEERLSPAGLPRLQPCSKRPWLRPAPWAAGAGPLPFQASEPRRPRAEPPHALGTGGLSGGSHPQSLTHALRRPFPKPQEQEPWLGPLVLWLPASHPQRPRAPER